METSIFDTPMGRELLKRSKVADMRSWMDLNEDPCNDFYNFACGNWKRINSAEIHKKFFSNKFEVVYTAMERRTEEFLSKPKDGNPIDDKIRDFYQSCKNVAYSRNEFKLALKNVYHEYGEFSCLKKKNDNESDSDNTFNWWSTLAKIYNTYGLSYIVHVNVDNHLNDHNRTMIFLERSESQVLDIMRGIMELFFTLILEVKEAEALKVVTNILDFQKTLSEAGTKASSGGRTPLEHYALYNTTMFKSKYKKLLNATEFLQTVLNVTDLPEELYIGDAKYFDDLVKIFNTTDPRTIEDYILWSLVEEYFIGILTCASTSNRYFGKYLQHTIYQQYRSEEYEKEIHKVWNELKTTFKERLQSGLYPWMTKGTTQNALQKLNKTEFMLNTYDNENFEDFYKDIEIDPANYVLNVQNVLKKIEALRQDKLEKTTVSLDDLQKEAFNPRYYDRLNQIRFPVSSLQPFHMWHTIYPKAIKYATWGSVMAHEMFHAFDDFGRHFDGNGSAITWWDEKSIKEFDMRKACFRRQYHEYTFNGQQMPDSPEQRENIADNGAVRFAFWTYQQWFNRNKQTIKDILVSESFRNFSYNKNQIFFISYAQFWCEDIDPQYHSYYGVNDAHGPSKIRINGALSNFNAFAQAFKCDQKAGAKMNPLEKCEIF